MYLKLSESVTQELIQEAVPRIILKIDLWTRDKELRCVKRDVKEETIRKGKQTDHNHKYLSKLLLINVALKHFLIFQK